MREVYHQFLSPGCRMVRLALAEKRLAHTAVAERFWENRPGFLAVNPAGLVPAMLDGETAVSGLYAIPEYLEETYPEHPLWPEAAAARTEARRLVDWYMSVFQDRVTALLLVEKINPRWCGIARAMPQTGPDPIRLRAGSEALRAELARIGDMADARRWLAGETLSYADLACAAQLSALDYLGDVPWESDERAKTWYMRIKSRPSFRGLLAEALPGLPPSRSYAALDF